MDCPGRCSWIPGASYKQRPFKFQRNRTDLLMKELTLASFQLAFENSAALGKMLTSELAS